MHFVRLFVILLSAILVTVPLGACDQVPSLDGDTQPPSVLDLDVRPERVRADTLDPSLVQDSLARVPIAIGARVEDPDGTVERVVFTVEPASSPRSTAVGGLELVEDNLYARQFGLSIPLRDEVYTIRVYAVDDDSLASNQGIGRFRFVADSTARASSRQ